MISRTVAIGSSVGLHARPASVLAEAVDDSGVEVTIAFDGEEADAASLLEIMTLGAKHGDVVTLSTEDDGAGEVLDSTRSWVLLRGMTGDALVMLSAIVGAWPLRRRAARPSRPLSPWPPRSTSRATRPSPR